MSMMLQAFIAATARDTIPKRIISPMKMARNPLITAYWISVLYKPMRIPIKNIITANIAPMIILVSRVK
jgi:hypothetical protein